MLKLEIHRELLTFFGALKLKWNPDWILYRMKLKVARPQNLITIHVETNDKP